MDASRLTSLLGRLPVTVGLSVVVCAVFGVELALGGTSDLTVLTRLGALHVGRVVSHGEAWRLVTALFLHAGWLHLVLNGLALVQLAALVELLFGSHRLLGFYLVSGLVANLASAVFNPAFFGVGQVGASGALFGLVGVIMGVALYGDEEWRPRLHRPLRALTLAVSFSLSLLVAQVWLGLPILIDHWAHAGGFVTGLLLAAAYPEPMTRTSPGEVALAAAGGGLVIGSFLSAAVWGGRALPDLPADVAAAYAARIDAADEGLPKGSLLASLVPTYRDVGVPEPEAAFRAELAEAAPDSLIVLQQLLYGQGRDDELLWTQEQWAALDPDQPDPWNGLAWTLVVHQDPARRDPQRALEAADRALALLAALPERDPPGHRMEALWLWSAGGEEVLRSQSRAAYLDTRAEALAQLGRREEALADQREAVRLGAASRSPAQTEMEARLARLEAGATTGAP